MAWDNFYSLAGNALDSGRDLHSRLVGVARELVSYSYHNAVSRMHTLWNRNEREYWAKIDESEQQQMRAQGIPVFEDPFALPTTYTFVVSRNSALSQLWRERNPRLPLRPRNANQELQVRKAEALLEYNVQKSRLDKMQTYRYTVADIYGYSPRKTVWDERRQITATYSWDPYAFFWDPYVPVDWCATPFCKFVGFQSTQHLVSLKRAGIYFNLAAIKSKISDDFLQQYGFGAERDLRRGSGSQRDELMGLDEPGTFRNFGSMGTAHHIIHEVYWWMTPREWFKEKAEELYLPEMDPEEPVIARVTIANGDTVIGFDYMEDTDTFPTGVIAPMADGLITVPESTVGLNSGITRFCNWLVQSHKEDVQINLNGIWLYDESKIKGSLISRRIHGMNVPVRKQAYGTDVRTALYQLPVTHTTEGHLAKIMELLQISERATGATDPVQGASAADQQGGRRTATELSIVARAAQGRYGLLSRLYDEQDTEDMVMQMYRNLRFMSKPLALRLTADIAALAKINPRVNTHFTVQPGDFDDVEIEYVPFDPQQLVFREKAADIKMQLFQIIQGNPQFAQRFDAWGWLVSIAHDLGAQDFDRYVVDQGGPAEMPGPQQPTVQGPAMAGPVPGAPAPPMPGPPPGAPMPGPPPGPPMPMATNGGPVPMLAGVR